MEAESLSARSNRLIVEAATGIRRLSAGEWGEILAHVAQVGFDPAPIAVAGGRLAGLEWEGRLLRGSDRLAPAAAHYLRHVVARAEWPRNSSYRDYLISISDVITDPATGIFTSKFQGIWQLTLMRQSGALRGPNGFEWVLVDYRVDLGHWVTAYQPAAGLDELQSIRRSDVRWHRQPY